MVSILCLWTRTLRSDCLQSRRSLRPCHRPEPYVLSDASYLPGARMMYDPLTTQCECLPQHLPDSALCAAWRAAC